MLNNNVNIFNGIQSKTTLKRFFDLNYRNGTFLANIFYLPAHYSDLTEKKELHWCCTMKC